MNLLFIKYNNYFNRIIKQESTISDYSTKSTQAGVPAQTLLNVNFNPNDDIYTEFIAGKGSFSPNCDYLVAYNLVENTPVIDSRWFITEAVRTRGGQYKLTLKRDVIVDNLDSVIEAPIYLEKGYIKDTTNPLLYNKESLSVNQIKQYEVPLKDETKCGWIVGYIPNN